LKKKADEDEIEGDKKTMPIFFHDSFVDSEFQKDNSATYCGSDRETQLYSGRY
jgi:hypothetical protein